MSLLLGFSTVLGFMALTAEAQTTAGLPVITPTGFTFKVEQVNGPCDWSSWDPRTKYGTPGLCGLTAAQGIPSQVLAQGLGYSFEDTATDALILLFSDTLGYDPALPLSPDPANKSFIQFNARDTVAVSGTKTTGDPFGIAYFSTLGSPTTPIFVTSGNQRPQLAAQPDGLQPSYVQKGTPVAMGPFDSALSGISLNGVSYFIVQTGAVPNADGSGADYSTAYSVLVKSDDVTAFTPGRTISQSNYAYIPKASPQPPPVPGHFVFTAFAELSDAAVIPPARDARPIIPRAGLAALEGPSVLTFGTGQFRASSLYLAVTPASSFWTGTDAEGNSPTVYFAGYNTDGNTPKWSDVESRAVPVLWDNPPTFADPEPGAEDPGTIGSASVFYDPGSRQWMMIYDGGRQSAATTGIYFTYAATPWGPWQKPRLIYNACQAHQDNRQGFGDIMFYYAATANDNDCPSALPGNPKFPAFAGPAGPVIDSTLLDPFGDAAFTRRGGAFAPEIISRFSGSKNGVLKLQYNISTWNPYTVVRMETDFTISQ